MSDYNKLTDCLIDKIATIPEENQRFMVCLSGGVDSTVLFDVFCQKKIFKKILDLSICHINFGLRGSESDADEAFVSQLGSSRGVKSNIHKVDLSTKPETGESTQVWARKARYKVFESYAAQGWTLVLAHHQDDLAENILLRIARGSSPIALAGMSVFSSPYFRPFLSIQKAELLNWSIRHNLPYREDSSNAKMDYGRNVIRQSVLPALENLFPGAAKRIARLGVEAHDISIFSRSVVNNYVALPKKSVNSLEKQTGILIPALLKYSDALIKDQISSFLSDQSDTELIYAEPNKINTSFLDLVLNTMKDHHNQNNWITAVPGGGFITILDDSLQFTYQQRKTKNSQIKKSFSDHYFLAPNTSIEITLPHTDALLSLCNKSNSTKDIEISSLEKSPFINSKNNVENTITWFSLKSNQVEVCQFSSESIHYSFNSLPVSSEKEQVSSPDIEINIVKRNEAFC
jgi:tRNA(Ile)-lysidine synthetase-like protein